MRSIELDNITQLAAGSFAGVPQARQRELLQALVQHLHAYAKDTRLTHEEWRAALAFLHRTGDISSASRSEFSLLSDVLGLSSLVDLIAGSQSSPGATPGSAQPATAPTAMVADVFSSERRCICQSPSGVRPAQR